MTADDSRIECRRAQNVRELLELRSRVLRPLLPLESARFAGDDDGDTRHWVAVRGDVVVGCVSVMVSDEPELGRARFHLRGMATDEGERSRGVGRKLLEFVHEDVGEPMWCNARIRAEPFYARAGWRRTSEVFEIEGVGPHYRMLFVPSSAGGAGVETGTGDTAEDAPASE